MAQHVISVNPFGEINHTLKDDVLKLSIGKRDIKRMSEIKHFPDVDRFYVQRMDGKPFVLDRINHELGISTVSAAANELYGPDCVLLAHIRSFTDTVPTYESYQEAVAFEVRLINAYRLKGLPIPGFDPK